VKPKTIDLKQIHNPSQHKKAAHNTPGMM